MGHRSLPRSTAPWPPAVPSVLASPGLHSHPSQNFKIEFHHHDEFDTSFSLISTDASIANAFRRILLAEIPTVAIETVYMSNNTSIIQDEVLAHRFGLIPLKGNKQGLNWLKWYKAPQR